MTLHPKEPKLLLFSELDSMTYEELQQKRKDMIEVYEHYDTAYYRATYEYRMKRMTIAIKRICKIEEVIADKALKPQEQQK